MDDLPIQPEVNPAGWRSSRFAELDAKIQTEGVRRLGKSHRKSKAKARRRSTPLLPAAVRKEITRLARELKRQDGQLFASDPKLKDRAAQLLRSLLPPKRRRGRPGIPSVTRAIALLKRYRRQYPGETSELIWKRIYPEAISNYSGMTKLEQADARQVLRERVRWRIRRQLR